MPRIGAVVLALALLAPLAASATEQITYTYDGRGRLIMVQHSGSVNNGLTVKYVYDKAGNRTRVTTTGASH